MDLWDDTSFEFVSEPRHSNDSDYTTGYLNFELSKDGSLEVTVCNGVKRQCSAGWMETTQEDVKFTPERTIELLVGLQVWLEGLDKPATIE